MQGVTDPAAYEAWYHTPRGRWIGARECALLRELLSAAAGDSLLDAGCGTGYFSRDFARQGLAVTGIDPDPAALEFARAQGEDIRYLQGSALALPFPDRSFDCTVAVASLCFIDDPIPAVREMWRVTRRTLVLGLLHRHSLLHWEKHGRGSYAGARWDTAGEVQKWIAALQPKAFIEIRYGIFLPGGGRFARIAEHCLPLRLPLGGFLAVALSMDECSNG